MVAEILRRVLDEIALGRDLAIAKRQEHMALAVERDLAAEVAAALRHRLEQLLDVRQPIVFEARANQRGGRRRAFLRAGRRRVADLLRVGDVKQAIRGELRVRRHFEQAALPLVHHRRHALDRVRQQLAIADNAQPPRAFGDQRVAARQERDRPGLDEPLHVRHDSIVVERRAGYGLAGHLDLEEDHAGDQSCCKS